MADSKKDRQSRVVKAKSNITLTRLRIQRELVALDALEASVDHWHTGVEALNE